MLFWQEMHNENKTEVKDYLVKYGKFKSEMIEGIQLNIRGPKAKESLM